MNSPNSQQSNIFVQLHSELADPTSLQLIGVRLCFSLSLVLPKLVFKLMFMKRHWNQTIDQKFLIVFKKPWPKKNSQKWFSSLHILSCSYWEENRFIWLSLAGYNWHGTNCLEIIFPIIKGSNMLRTIPNQA